MPTSNPKTEQPATAEQVESAQNKPIRSAAKPTIPYALIRENIGRKKRKRRQIVEQPERPPTTSEQKQAEMLRVQARQLTAKAAEPAPVTDDDLPL